MYENSSKIKYRYALNDQGDVVDVFCLTAKDRQDYHCLGCGKVLRPALGEIRKKHFRHKVVDQCSPETYLHRMGVWLFQESYMESLEKRQPFYLEVPVTHVCQACPDGPCTLAPASVLSDLTQNYLFPVSESRDQVNGEVFIPDVLLHDGQNQKLYVEIVVSHQASKKKIDSSLPILEIDINCEEDFDLILGKEISHKDSRIRLINFQKEVAIVDSSDDCELLKERKVAEAFDLEAKSKFKDFYEKLKEEQKPFKLLVKHPQECHACSIGPCRIGTFDRPVDLLKYFPQIVKEPPGLGEVNHRLALVNESGRKIYFETSGVFQRRPDREKFLKSGIELVEITFKSLDFVTDVEGASPLIATYTFHNIDPKPIRQDDPNNCPQRLHVFIVNQAGKARIDWMTLFELEQCRKVGRDYLKEVESEGFDIFIEEVEAAYKAGVSIKNCYVCRYHAGANTSYYSRQERKGGIFCKHLKRTCSSNQAAECGCYRPDPEVFGTERYPQRKQSW